MILRAISFKIASCVASLVGASLLAVLAAPISGLSQEPKRKPVEWKILRHDGRDYVTWENVRQFYGLTYRHARDGRVEIGDARLHVHAKAGSDELIINGVRFHLCFPTVVVGKEPSVSRLDLVKLIEPVLRPGRLKASLPFSTVVIDAAYGGNDPGPGGDGKATTLALAREFKAALEKRGMEAVLTRDSDITMSAVARAAAANAVGGAVFIGIELRAGGDEPGMESRVLAPQGGTISGTTGSVSVTEESPGNAQDESNICLATALHAVPVAKFKLVDRGVRRSGSELLRALNIPAVILEPGNPAMDSLFLKSPVFAKTFGEALADAVVNYRKATRRVEASSLPK